MTIAELRRRPKLYFNIDGVGELGAGFFFLGCGLLTWLQDHTPQDSIWRHGFLIYFGVMLAIIHFGGKAIKEHITYPRTGFVEYRKSDRWRAGIMGAVAAPLVLIAALAAHRHHWHMTNAVSVYGVLLAVGLAFGGFARTAGWKWVVVLLGAVGSLGISALPADLVGALADHTPVPGMVPAKLVGAWLLLLLYWGTLLMVSGGISLWLYVRNTAPLDGEAA
jgi:hypothetical protein